MAETKPHILVIPHPAPGHMFPLFDLARLLSHRFGLALTIAVTPLNRLMLDPLLALSPSIKPVVFDFPPHPSFLPGIDHYRGPALSSVPAFTHALAGLRDELRSWYLSQPDRPDAIISDLFLGWTDGLAKDLGIPRLVFSPFGALDLAVLHFLWRRMPKRSNPHDPLEPVSFPCLPNSPVLPWCHTSPIYRSYKKGDTTSEFFRASILDNTRSCGFLINTFSDLEKVYLDHLRADLGHPRVWAVGPLSTEPWGPTVAGDEVMTWLDGCEEGSVVYVCFGSEGMLEKPQAAALAAALEQSKVRFVWAIWGITVVPDGFEDRTA